MSDPLVTIPQAIEELKAGRMIVLVDDEDRENEGDLVCLAGAVTPEIVNFMAVHARGLICMPMEKAIAKGKEAIDALAAEIKALSAGIVALDKSVAEATEQRKDQ